MSPEDEGALRQLERSLGHGVPRAKAPGFDYAAPPAPGAATPRENLNMPQARKGGGGPGAGATSHGGRLAAWKDPAARKEGPRGKPGGGKQGPKKDWRHK